MTGGIYAIVRFYLRSKISILLLQGIIEVDICPQSLVKVPLRGKCAVHLGGRIHVDLETAGTRSIYDDVNLDTTLGTNAG